VDLDPVRVERGHERPGAHVEEGHRDRHGQHAEHQRETGERSHLVDAFDDDKRADDDEEREHRGVLVHVAPRHPVGGEPSGHDRHEVGHDADDSHRPRDLPHRFALERQVHEVPEHRGDVGEQRHVEGVVGGASPLQIGHGICTLS
jgi:hypothetical protein